MLRLGGVRLFGERVVSCANRQIEPHKCHLITATVPRVFTRQFSESASRAPGIVPELPDTAKARTEATAYRKNAAGSNQKLNELCYIVCSLFFVEYSALTGLFLFQVLKILLFFCFRFAG
jgi:hypothetical protein